MVLNMLREMLKLKCCQKKKEIILFQTSYKWNMNILFKTEMVIIIGTVLAQIIYKIDFNWDWRVEKHILQNEGRNTRYVTNTSRITEIGSRFIFVKLLLLIISCLCKWRILYLFRAPQLSWFLGSPIAHHFASIPFLLKLKLKLALLVPTTVMVVYLRMKEFMELKCPDKDILPLLNCSCWMLSLPLCITHSIKPINLDIYHCKFSFPSAISHLSILH